MPSRTTGVSLTDSFISLCASHIGSDHGVELGRQGVKVWWFCYGGRRRPNICPFGRQKEGGVDYRPYMTTRQVAKLTVRKLGHVRVGFILYFEDILLPYHTEM
jgi:hypothetical protein